MHVIKIYLKLIRISLQSRMSYKTDFFTGVAGIIIFNGVNIGMISILATKFTTINGWNVWELIFLYCLWLLSHSFNSLLFWHFTSLEQYLRNGTFDQFIIRPVSPLVQFLGREIQYLGVGDIFISTVGLAFSYQNLDISWGFIDWGFFILAVISGTVIEMAIYWIIASISFWTVRTHSAFLVLWQINSIIQQYPVNLFGNWFRLVVTVILPVAFMNYYPSLYLLKKIDLKDPISWLSLLSPLVALILLILGFIIWQAGLKKYSSTGN